MGYVAVPKWLDERRPSWIPCRVVESIPPVGFAVEVDIDGQERTMIVPADALRFEDVPGTGQILVTIVAELPTDDPFGQGLIAELPAVPQQGSQRVKVKKEEVKAA